MCALAGLFAFAFLMALPRFLARFYASVHPSRKAPKHDASRPNYAFEAGLHEKMHSVEAGVRKVSGGDLWKGWFLRSGRPGSIGRRSAGDDPFECGNCTDVLSPTSRADLAPPPHMRPVTSRLPGAWIWTAAPFSNMPWFLYTSAETRTLFLVAAYLGFCIAAMVYKCDLGPQPPKELMPYGPGYNFKRSGVIAMTQIPVAIALGVRGNIPGLALGKSYDRMRIIHKVSGRVMFFAGAFHSIGYLVAWGKSGKLAEKSKSLLGMTGWAAFMAICVIAVTSLPAVRRWAYGLFKVSHVLGVLCCVIGMYWHHESCPPWMLASGGIYGAHFVFTLMKTRVADAEIQALGGTTTTLVTIPRITSGWRAGQHVRIRIIGLGLLSAECHPFTIANAPDTPGGMVLMVKAAGDWTSRLYETASSGGHATQLQAESGVWRRKAKVIIEGPYGGLGNTLSPAFSSVVLVAGGSGISHSLGIAEDLINRSPSGVVSTRTIDLIWVVRVEQVARALMPHLNNLVARAKSWEANALNGRRHGADLALPTALRVHIFVTRVPKSSPLTLITGPARMTSEPEKLCEKLSPTGQPSQPSLAYGYPGSSDSGHNGYADGYYDHTLDGHGNYQSSDGHGYQTSDGHSSDWHIRPDLTYSANGTLAEKAKADWLAKNPSTFTLASLQQRQTDCTEPMSSIWAYRGRPDLKGSISTIVDETIARHGRSITDPRGLFVTSCGPEYLVNDTRDACQAVASWKKDAVHGVEFESEFFGL
jgi:predicted ferric reductase